MVEKYVPKEESDITAEQAINGTEKNALFDPEQEHTIHALLEGVIPNASDTFLVKGKKFIVKSISLKVTPDGFDPEYQATLYSIC